MNIQSQYELDQYYMERALGFANQALKAGEVPVGAVIVQGVEIIGEGFNCPISHCDPSAHAEVMAIRNSGQRVGNYRLNNSTLYVTLEPCIMCAGAILHARIDRVVFAARDPRSGAGGSLLNLLESKFLNHRCQVQSGILENQAKNLLSTFFSSKR